MKIEKCKMKNGKDGYLLLAKRVNEYMSEWVDEEMREKEVNRRHKHFFIFYGLCFTLYDGIFGFGNWDLIWILTFGFGILHIIMLERRNLHFRFGNLNCLYSLWFSYKLLNLGK